MDVPGTVKNIFINWFADVQHWEIGRGSRLATLGHVKLPRSQAMRCRVAPIPSWRCRLGGSKCHQLQIAGNTNKTLKLSKIQLHFGIFDKIQLQARLHDRCECSFYPLNFIIGKLCKLLAFAL